MCFHRILMTKYTYSEHSVSPSYDEMPISFFLSEAVPFSFFRVIRFVQNFIPLTSLLTCINNNRCYIAYEQSNNRISYQNYVERHNIIIVCWWGLLHCELLISPNVMHISHKHEEKVFLLRPKHAKRSTRGENFLKSKYIDVLSTLISPAQWSKQRTR